MEKGVLGPNKATISKTSLQTLLKRNKSGIFELVNEIICLKISAQPPPSERRSCSSVQVFIITDVRIISLHLPFNHRLLPSAAGNCQTDEEGLQTKTPIRDETFAWVWLWRLCILILHETKHFTDLLLWTCVKTEPPGKMGRVRCPAILKDVCSLGLTATKAQLPK